MAEYNSAHPLTVESITPAAHATDVPRNSTIIIEFSDELLISTVTSMAYVLQQVGGNTIATSVRIASDHKTVHIVPQELLTNLQSYTLTLFASPLGFSSSYSCLEEALHYTFTVGTSFTDDVPLPGDAGPVTIVPDALHIVQTSPQTGDSNVAPYYGAVTFTCDQNLPIGFDLSDWVTVEARNVMTNTLRPEPQYGWAFYVPSTDRTQLHVLPAPTTLPVLPVAAEGETSAESHPWEPPMTEAHGVEDPGDDTVLPDFLANTEYTITVKAGFPGMGDHRLAQDCTVQFTSLYTPYFTDLNSVLLDLGPLGADIDENTLHMTIMRSSFRAASLWYRGNNPALVDPLPDCIRDYVEAKTRLDGLAPLLLSKVASGSLTLADLKVSTSNSAVVTYLLHDRKELLQEVRQLSTLVRSGCKIARPRGVVKGAHALTGRAHPQSRPSGNRLLSHRDLCSLEQSAWGTPLSAVDSVYASQCTIRSGLVFSGGTPLYKV